MAADTQATRTEAVKKMADAARKANAARDEAVNGDHTGRAWLDAQGRWTEAERTLGAAEDRLLEAFSNGR